MVTMTVHDAVLAWAVPPGWVALSSAAVGGGLVRPRWVVNIGVEQGFARTDLQQYVEEVTAHLGLPGPGCALLTAADVTQVQHASSGGVQTWATVGVTKPTWALAPTTDPDRPAPETEQADSPPPPGTINIVVAVPAGVALSASALVQAVGTITEAKSQALLQGGVPGTGTSSDAVVVLSPEAAIEARDGHAPPGDDSVITFAGVRSTWGQHIARAVHTAVAAGLAAHPWPPEGHDPETRW